MKLLDLITAPWAIVPDQLLEMQAIYATHLRGDKIDIPAIEARLGRPLASDQQEYSVREGGVAVLPIEGVIAPKANMFTRISGGASAQMLQTQLESAMADSRVKSLILQIDSPGGSVFGTPELAASVREYSATKPIVTVSDVQMSSAAYWIGSAANAMFITGPTVHVGSIGVVANHEFRPSFSGAKTTEITAGRYKRIASSNAPLSEEGRAYLQAQVDHLYSAFVDIVAAHRGVDAQTVLEHMADGRVFIGQQAIDVGLVDGMSSVDAMVEQLATDPKRFSKRFTAVIPKPKASAGAPKPEGASAESDAAGVVAEGDLPPPSEGGTTMPDPITREALEKEHPALFASLKSEFTAEGAAAGAAAERQRITDVRAQTLPGHEALIERLAFDGKTTGAQAAMAVMDAHRQAILAAAKNHFDDAPPAAPPSAAADDKPLEGKAAARAVGKGAVALFNSLKGAQK